jgi:Transposase IS116/IS110/IS902 family/Transposase
MSTSAWTCTASAPRSPSWMPPVSSSATATWPTTRPSCCRSLARCHRAPRWRSRRPTGGVGWSTCSTTSAWNRTWSTQAAARRSPRPGCRNDKVDAATLAQLLRADLLPEAWIAPQQVRDLRGLLRHRAALVRLSTSCKNRVHAVLADRGIGQDRGLWTGPGRAWLQALPLPPVAREVVDDCCGLLDTLATPIARLEREIAGLAKPDPRVQALMALPGVGRLTAMTVVAEIGDISRFPTARKLCAWAGLTPRCVTPTAGSATATSPTRAPRGCEGSCRRPPRPPSVTPCSPPPTASSPIVEARTSPPWPSPGGCWPGPFTS